MKKITTIILVSLLQSTVLLAQEKEKKSFKNGWEVEVDPIAYLMNGHSVHAIYQYGRFRFDAGSYGIEVPEGFQQNDGFKLKNEGFGVKANYLLQGVNGFYSGLGIGYSDLEATDKQTGERRTGNSIGIGVDLGYRLFFKKEKDGDRNGLYLTPWVGINYNFFPDQIKFTSKEYKQEPLEFFPTVHIGYRF